jgi:hypothetical protein
MQTARSSRPAATPPAWRKAAVFIAALVLTGAPIAASAQYSGADKRDMPSVATQPGDDDKRAPASAAVSLPQHVEGVSVLGGEGGGTGDGRMAAVIATGVGDCKAVYVDRPSCSGGIGVELTGTCPSPEECRLYQTSNAGTVDATPPPKLCRQAGSSYKGACTR